MKEEVLEEIKEALETTYMSKIATYCARKNIVKSNSKERYVKTALIVLIGEKTGDVYSIPAISKIGKIPTSSVQRYLNDEEFITDIFGPARYDYIKERLEKNKENGKHIGAEISRMMNVPVKDRNGKFQGSKRDRR